MKIKLCGLFREEDIACANEVRPDYVGFVFYEKSRRNVTPGQAARLRRLLRKEIPAVGVFVDEPPENVIRYLAEGIIDIAQLHGGETEETVRLIREASRKPVIRAVKVSGEADVTRWLPSEADYLLFDNGMGTGHSFAWDNLPKIDRPFFLAGGLGPANLEEAMRRVRPYCVDISSGAETDGLKDPAKMRKLTDMVRRFR